MSRLITQNEALLDLNKLELVVNKMLAQNQVTPHVTSLEEMTLEQRAQKEFDQAAMFIGVVQIILALLMVILMRRRCKRDIEEENYELGQNIIYKGQATLLGLNMPEFSYDEDQGVKKMSTFVDKDSFRMPDHEPKRKSYSLAHKGLGAIPDLGAEQSSSSSGQEDEVTQEPRSRDNLL